MCYRPSVRLPVRPSHGWISHSKMIEVRIMQFSRLYGSRVMVNGKENIDPQPFFYLSDNSHGLRGHSFKLSLNRSGLDLRKHFISQRVISSWNSLPQHVQWRNDGVAAASRDGGPHWQGGPRQFQVHND